jgi:hypothetical protein
MKIKRLIDVSIFTVAVIMLLLRPFMVYQMTQSPALSKDPAATWSLLQRLIKKKDDHHTAEVQEYFAVSQVNKKTLPGIIPANAYNRHSSSFIALKVNDYFLQPSTFKVRPAIKQYRLFSKYQI